MNNVRNVTKISPNLCANLFHILSLFSNSADGNTWLHEWWIACNSKEKTPPSLQLFCAKAIYCIHQTNETKEDLVIATVGPNTLDYRAPEHAPDQRVGFLDLMQLFNGVQANLEQFENATLDICIEHNKFIDQLQLPNAIRKHLKVERRDPDITCPSLYREVDESCDKEVMVIIPLDELEADRKVLTLAGVIGCRLSHPNHQLLKQWINIVTALHSHFFESTASPKSD